MLQPLLDLEGRIVGLSIYTILTIHFLLCIYLNCGYLNSSHTAWLVWTLETWNSLLILLSWRNWLDVTTIAWFGRKNSWFKHIHHINHSFSIMYLLELWLLDFKSNSLTRMNTDWKSSINLKSNRSYEYKYEVKLLILALFKQFQFDQHE